MRHLVACDQCRRQYDATGRRPGRRFRCRCGGVITVTEPEVHEASVVRCSACGGSREGEAESCSYCGATFTLHERDLNTICPGCLARVSDRARYCHHCSAAIAPESDAGGHSDAVCPACSGDQHLMSRQLGGSEHSVLECDRCAGLWVGSEVFRRLEERAKDRTLPDWQGQGQLEAPPGAPSPLQTGNLYRKCVVCSKMMNRQNYGRTSGVVIDLCHNHGVWFDDTELARILSWLRDGGFARSQRRFEEELKQEARQVRFDKAMSFPDQEAAMDRSILIGQGDFVTDVVEGLLIGGVRGLFR